MQAKRHSKEKRKEVRATALWQRVVVDTMEMGMTSRGGSEYAIVFVEEFSRMVMVVPVARKSDSHKALQRVMLEWALPAGTVIFSDNGTEFRGKFEELCAKHSLRHECSPAYCPQLNGIVERENKEVANMIRACLIHAFGVKDNVVCQHSLWAECCRYVEVIRNHSKHSILNDKTPLGVARGLDNDAVHDMMRRKIPAAFGEGCMATTQEQIRKRHGRGFQKFVARAVKARFLGWNEKNSSYRLLVERGNRIM